MAKTGEQGKAYWAEVASAYDAELKKCHARITALRVALGLGPSPEAGKTAARRLDTLTREVKEKGIRRPILF